MVEKLSDKESSMLRKRPCCVCRKWFRPDPRVGERQRACSDKACQQERHRRACAAWRKREAPGAREDRLRARLKSEEGGLDREVLRDVMGTQGAVVLEETVRLLGYGTRDAFRSQVLEITRESIRLLPRRARDETVPRGASP